MRRIAYLFLAAIFALSACGNNTTNADCGRVRRQPSDYASPLDQCYIYDFSILGSDKRVIVYYDGIPEVDTNPSDGVNDWAAKAGIWTAETWAAFVEYGFSSPARTTNKGVEEIEVWIYPRDGISTIGLKGILVAAESINEREDVHETIIHELFHVTQVVQLPGMGYPGWFTEGTAQVMQDHTDATIDMKPNGFYGCANLYLNTPEEDITTRPNECATALWWKYFMEQLNTDPREPRGGAGVLAEFMDSLSSSENFLDQLDTFIRSRSSIWNLERLWCNFTVANYVKNLSGPGIHRAHRYVDESQPPGAYDADDDPNTPPVKLDRDFALTVAGEGAIVSGLQLPPWAAKYYRVRPAPNISSVDVGFSSDQRVSYALLVIDDDDLVEEIREVSSSFHQVVANQEFDEIVVVVATLRNSAEYGFDITAH